MRPQRLLEISKNLILWACIFLYIATCIITFVQVICRYFLGHPLIASEEVARYCFVWLVLLGSSIAMWERAHIELTFLVDRFSARINLWLRLLTDAITVVVTMIFFVIEGLRLSLMTMRQFSPATGIPMGWVYLALPVSGVLIILAIINSIIATIKRLSKSESAVIKDLNL